MTDDTEHSAFTPLLCVPNRETTEFAEFTNSMIGRIAASLGIPRHIMGTYRNPFCFLGEFDRWFEFTKRKIADKEPTMNIIEEMLEGDERNVADYLETNYSGHRRYA